MELDEEFMELQARQVHDAWTYPVDYNSIKGWKPGMIP